MHGHTYIKPNFTPEVWKIYSKYKHVTKVTFIIITVIIMKIIIILYYFLEELTVYTPRHLMY
jgi:uncharacterized Rmd1/YagE family protein